MNAFIIFLLAWLGIGSYDKLSKKAEAKRYRIENRGSRDVELEEWTRWSKTLFESYKQLTGLNIPYPKIRFTKGNIGHAFRNAFNGTANYPREIDRWSDRNALEVLRVRHNLPTDDEIYTIKEWQQKTKIVHRPTLYTNLAYIIAQCVFRAVHERGYKYGGTYV